MKIFLLAFILLPYAALRAQPPAGPPPLGQPPFGKPPFPGMLGFGDSGLMGLRSMPPDRGLVTKKIVSPASFTLMLKFSNSSQTFTQIGPTEETMKVVNHLVEGRSYDFPKVFDEILGPKAPAWPPAPPGSAPAPFNFEQIGRTAPFRARLVNKTFKEGVVSLEIHCMDGPQLTLSQSAKESVETARMVGERLEVGEIYEFPDAVFPAVLRRDAGKPRSPLIQSLAPLIGQWTGPLSGQPDIKSTVRYLWKSDGQGIWKEIKAETQHGSTIQESAWLITYDAARHCYLETPTRPDAPGAVLEMSWEPKSKTLSFHAVPDRREPDTISGGTRTVTSPDRMDWHFSRTTTDGRVLGENSGSYTRVK